MCKQTLKRFNLLIFLCPLHLSLFPFFLLFVYTYFFLFSLPLSLYPLSFWSGFAPHCLTFSARYLCMGMHVLNVFKWGMGKSSERNPMIDRLLDLQS